MWQKRNSFTLLIQPHWGSVLSFLKKIKMRVKEMARWLKELVAFPENPSLILKTLIVAHICLQLQSQGI